MFVPLLSVNHGDLIIPILCKVHSAPVLYAVYDFCIISSFPIHLIIIRPRFFCSIICTYILLQPYFFSLFFSNQTLRAAFHPSNHVYDKPSQRINGMPEFCIEKITPVRHGILLSFALKSRQHGKDGIVRDSLPGIGIVPADHVMILLHF